MPLITARYQPQLLSQDRIKLSNGCFVDRDGSAVFFAPLDTVRDLSLASLRRCLAAAAAQFDVTWADEHVVEELYLTESAVDQFDDGYSPRSAYSFGLIAAGELRLHISVPTTIEADEDFLATRLAVFLVGNRLSLVGMEQEGVPGSILLTLAVRSEARGRTVGDAYALAEQLDRLVQALVDGTTYPATWWDLLVGGHATALVGQPESATLEAKSRAYDPAVEADQIELAQDVARFANAEHGGLLCLGFRTRHRGMHDVIEKVTPVNDPSPQRLVARYRSIVDRKIFPPVVGVEIAAVPLPEAGCLILLRIPAQPEELKPFLVHGAIAAGKVEGAFISIVRRRGEDSIPVTPAAIHSWMSAGRALMRAGHLPDPRQPSSETTSPTARRTPRP
ncbi:hypothetical protein AB0H43_22290 [Hamadaea sp. NPDC050747]|uniref:AlbA family DNA-binding domain-containing protein n=1 Tax=Hamadaea sp. NPDC050747 TaxID=3155789 RepID=UPI0033F8948C